MHIDVNLNTIRELTRYISPKEIEKARYKKFNTPKLNDGNLACDKFFKEEELFDRHIYEIDYGYRTYGIDDLPVYYNGAIERDITHYTTQQGNYTLETGYPEYVTLLKNGKRIYTEKFEYLSENNPIKMQIESALNEGCTLQSSINILDAAYIDINFKNDIFQEGLNLLKAKYPLETVLRYIEMAKLKNFKGDKSYIPGTLNFISQYPHLRELIIQKNIYNSEVLDTICMKTFPRILKKCKTEEDAIKIAKACQHKTFFNIDTNRKHVEFALYMYAKNQKWTKSDTALLVEIGNSADKMNKAGKLFEKGYKSKEIIHIIKTKKS